MKRLILAALLATVSPGRDLPADVLEDKIRGGLLGQIIANLNGLKHENKYVAEPGKVETYVPSLPEGGWTDDDTDIEWVYLFGMERANTILLPRDRMAELWKAHINQRIWCSHRYVRQLINIGIEPPLTGSVHLNPWASFNLSGQFVSESWGLISPGMPGTASRISLHYLRASIDGEPAQAAQMFAAMVAEAFFTTDIDRILDTGAASIDPKSQMAKVLADVRQWHKQYPNDWQATRKRIRDEYTLFPDRVDMRDLNGVILNGASTFAALLYGEGDFADTVRHAFNFGWDADNTAATSGTIIGVMKGHKWFLSQGWDIKDTFRNTSRDGLPNETITRFGDRLIRLAEKVIVSEGGKRTSPGFTMPLQKPSMAEPLADAAVQLKRLRETLGPEIEQDVMKPPHEQAAARAAYLAIALDLGSAMRQKHPEPWNRAIDALSGYSGLVQLLFYDSPGETGEHLRRQALAAGLPQPPKEPKR